MKGGVTWVLAAAVAATGGVIGAKAYQQRDGCRAYIPADGVLVAHAGGGLPNQTYANTKEALNLAAQHGFRLVELDFRQAGNSLTIGHDAPSGLTLDQLAEWMRANPTVSLITDVKTNNIAGLKIIAARLGTDRIIPQIYQPEQLAPAKALGFRRVIFAERIGESESWYPWVNSADLWAVTLHKDRLDDRRKYSRPVFYYTVNAPTGRNVYTDCLIPRQL